MPRYQVHLEVSHAGGWRAWNLKARAFEQCLAALVSPVVREAVVESENRRGPGLVRIHILVTVAAADVGQAAVVAWDVFRVAAGEDLAAWDLAGTSAGIQPTGTS